MASDGVSVVVKAVDTPADGVIISDSAARAWGLSNQTEVRLGMGAFDVSAPLAIDPRLPQSSLLIGAAIAETLPLALPLRLKAFYDAKAGMLRFGPFIAIFARKRTKARGPRSRSLFGVRTLDMRQLLRHGRRLGACVYVITPDSVGDAGRGVQGYVISGKRWRIRRFPVPDVVYDRIQSRAWEREKQSERAKSLLKSYARLKYFNDGFFDKWNIHQKMLSNALISPYLPETKPLDSPDALKAFLHKHASVFIKPTEGSLGRGVIRIRRRGGAYEWRRGGRTHRTARFDALYANIARRSTKSRYIMQPDLRLATLGGAPFDIRLLMQKDGQGQWRRTKTYARVAVKGSLTSNLSRGGTAMGLRSVLRGRFGRSGNRINRRVRQAAFEIVRGLDQVLGEPLGELGLDLGVSNRGRIWLIEVNSKPFRKVFTAGPKLAVFRSFRRPMAYACYLARN